MHVRDLVEVAGLVALNGPLIVSGSPSPASAHLEQYWATSRGRFESWSRVLKRHATFIPPPNVNGHDHWVELRAVLDEIFVSEMLTRVWSAVLVARDRRTQTVSGEPVARSVLGSHLEARHRALFLLLHSQGFTTQQAVTINRLRRRAERWTDVLIGGLLEMGDVSEFAIDSTRVIDFAGDLAQRRDKPGGRQAWHLTLVSLRNAFQTGLCPISANPDANARITASILGCFPGGLFDSTGVFQSLWMTRLSAMTSDAQGLISDLLGPAREVERSGPRLPRPRRI